MITVYGHRGDPRDVTTTAAYVVPPATDKAGVLAAFGTALRFPDWYGANYDALADLLRDLSWLPDGPRTVVWDGVATLRAADPDVYRTIREILAESGLDVVALMR